MGSGTTGMAAKEINFLYARICLKLYQENKLLVKLKLKP